ncbi:hypothetical protein JL720_15312 [Aureococcus anophagefferens]|nr:hypothetical protein JL720_15312 [Aureococcus anophagefferens]
MAQAWAALLLAACASARMRGAPRDPARERAAALARAEVQTIDERLAFLDAFRARGHAVATRIDVRDFFDAAGLSEDMHGPAEQLVATLGRAFVGSEGHGSSAFLERGGVGAAASDAWPYAPYWFREWSLAWDGGATRREDPAAGAPPRPADAACRRRGQGFDVPRLRCQADGDAPGPAPPPLANCTPPSRVRSFPTPPPFVGYDYSGDECSCAYARGLSLCPAKKTGRSRDRARHAAAPCAR